MKLNRKFRTTLRWFGLMLTVLFVVLWLASGVCYFGHASRVRRIEIVDGRFQLWQGYPDLTSPNWYYGTNRRYRLVNRIEFQGPYVSPWNANAVLIPLWYFAIVAAVPTGVMWAREISKRHRTLKGKCRHCKFDLAGLPSGGVCPECGNAALASAST